MATASVRMLLHALIRRKGLALDDADGRHQPPVLGIDELDRLLLDQGVELLVEAEVVGRDRVVAFLARHVDELHLRGIVLLRQRVDLELGLDAVGRLLDAAADIATHHVPDPIGVGLDHVVALRHLAVVPGRQHQVLAALALVGTGRAHVAEIAHVHVVEDAQHVRGQLNDGGAVLFQVEEAPGVERGVVAGQHQRLGVHQVFPDEDLVALLGADVPLTLA